MPPATTTPPTAVRFKTPCAVWVTASTALIVLSAAVIMFWRKLVLSYTGMPWACARATHPRSIATDHETRRIVGLLSVRAHSAPHGRDVPGDSRARRGADQGTLENHRCM